ncbi:Capsular polysaccharide type 8 biosynthesis protein cap8A [compost metagenome]
MIVQPQYQASASLVATITSTESGTYNELLASQMLTRTYEDAIKSRYIANEVKEKLNLSESIYDLLQRIDVRTDPGTLVIMLYATHDNPEDAVRISNAFADAFIAKSTEIVQSANVIVLDYADMEDASIPVSPRKMLNLAIGGFIGIFVALGISMLLERRRITRKGKYRKAEIEGIYN